MLGWPGFAFVTATCRQQYLTQRALTQTHTRLLLFTLISRLIVISPTARSLCSIFHFFLKYGCHTLQSTRVRVRRGGSHSVASEFRTNGHLRTPTETRVSGQIPDHYKISQNIYKYLFIRASYSHSTLAMVNRCALRPGATYYS